MRSPAGRIHFYTDALILRLWDLRQPRLRVTLPHKSEFEAEQEYPVYWLPRKDRKE